MTQNLSWLRRFSLLATATAVGVALVVPGALATPPEHVLERARQAVTEGKQVAEQLENGAADEERATGLDRAAEAIEAAAARKAERDGSDFPGNGRALGRGHSTDVHAILAAGGSPSDLPPHGKTVSTLAKAFETVKADHPGRGHGLAKEKSSKGFDDDSDD
jgi:hypothetical protein